MRDKSLLLNKNVFFSKKFCHFIAKDSENIANIFNKIFCRTYFFYVPFFDRCILMSPPATSKTWWVQVFFSKNMIGCTKCVFQRKLCILLWGSVKLNKINVWKLIVVAVFLFPVQLKFEFLLEVKMKLQNLYIYNKLREDGIYPLNEDYQEIFTDTKNRQIF